MEPGFKACPYCAEAIREAATVCRYCNRTVGGPPPPAEAGPLIAVVAKNPWRAILSITALFAILLFGFWLYMHSQHTGTRRPLPRRVSSAEAPAQVPAAEAPPPATPVALKLLSENLQVEAKQIRWLNFSIPSNATNVQINGTFHAFGGGGNDIWVILTDPVQFENWKNNHETQLFYNSGKVTNGVIAVQGLQSGQYVLVFDNRSSTFSRKEVSGEITLSYLLP